MKPPTKLRIVFYDPSGSGGICHYTYELAESLSRAGVDVTVLTIEDYELKHLPRSFKLKIIFRRSRVIRCLFGWMSQIRGKLLPEPGAFGDRQLDDQPDPAASKRISILGILQLLRFRIILLRAVWSFLLSRPHVIHFQWLTDHNEDYYFIRLLKLFRFTVVYTAHDVLPHDCNSPHMQQALNRIYRMVDRIIVHAESNKKEIISMFDVHASCISVIPHGSYELVYAHKHLSKEVARQELGIPQEKSVILFFGVIKRYKGLEYLVDAFRQVKTKESDAMLLIVGRIYDGDAEGFR
ncbi:MAG: glycosyltransferase, partial [Nitrososphaera sp.]